MEGREPTSRSRREFLAAVLTRAESDARGYLVALSQRWPRVSFWASLLFFVVIGGSVVGIFSVLGLSLFYLSFVLAGVFVLALCEATYREWRDTEAKFSNGDSIQLRGEMLFQHSSPLEHVPDAFAISYSPDRHKDADEIGIDSQQLPVAIRFDRPRSGLVRADQLPCEVKVRNGLRRYRLAVLAAVPGGFVVDSQERPAALSEISCSIFFSPQTDESLDV